MSLPTPTSNELEQMRAAIKRAEAAEYAACEAFLDNTDPARFLRLQRAYDRALKATRAAKRALAAAEARQRDTAILHRDNKPFSLFKCS